MRRHRLPRHAARRELTPAMRPLLDSGILSILHTGEITTCELLPWGSNYTFLVAIKGPSGTVLAVYKPKAGEIPLWDFPEGTLYLREYAAFLVSEALHWSLVPPTTIREGPYGIGSVQLYVDADPDVHYFNLDAKHRSALRRIALFDHVVNNADRKAGHCLEDRNGRLWAVDHGLTFHAVPKLRTVIWDFRGQPIPEDLLVDLVRLKGNLMRPGPLVEQLSSLLSASEMVALHRRVNALIEARTFPHPGPGRSVPWPLV